MKKIEINVPKGFYFDEERSNIVLSRIEKNKPARDKAIELIDLVLRQRVDYPTAKSIAYLMVDNVIDALIGADVKGNDLYYWSDVKHNITKFNIWQH